jgi:C1A family cysteine protease
VQGQTYQDRGACISVGCRSLQTYGLCSEDMWPYDPEMEPVRPPMDTYDEAQDHKIHTPAQISSNDIDHVKDSLAQGKPVIIGIAVYSEFMDDDARETGEIPLPGYGSRKQGNHAVLVVGYDDYQQKWICRNSWGRNWGDRG